MKEYAVELQKELLQKHAEIMSKLTEIEGAVAEGAHRQDTLEKRLSTDAINGKTIDQNIRDILANIKGQVDKIKPAQDSAHAINQLQTILNEIQKLDAKVDDQHTHHIPVQLVYTIQTTINEIKPHMDRVVGEIQQNVIQELADKLLQLETNHNTGLETQKQALDNVRATLESYKTQIENNTQEVKTEMTQIIRNEMDRHVADLKQQLTTIATAQTHSTHTQNRRVANHLAQFQMGDLDTKIDLLQDTIKGNINNATEAKFQSNYCYPFALQMSSLQSN
eukprot:1310393-Rhodomonas_salina.1